jgi:phospholipase C
MYDENDGYFDHVLPPTAPAGTADEYVDGVPIGLGFRVPCTIVSPWSVGGHVATETFDHTSMILFLEIRFGVTEQNISAWRRQTVGDLTSAFQSSQARPFPAGNQALTVSSTTRTLLAAQQEVADNPAPTVPAVNTPPVQDTTSRTGLPAAVSFLNLYPQRPRFLTTKHGAWDVRDKALW